MTDKDQDSKPSGPGAANPPDSAGSECPGPDDPRLTAFALGEIRGKEAGRVETAVAGNPDLAATVEAIRAQAESLRVELTGRSGAVELTGDRQEFVLATARKISWRMESVAQEPRPLSARLRLSERELALFWSGVGAAAAVLIMVVWQVSTGNEQRRVGSSQRPAVAQTDPAGVESSALKIDFLETIRPPTEADAAHGVPVRRLPSELAVRHTDGWWPLAAVRVDPGQVVVANDIVRPSTAFPLWIDDASFDLGREALLGEQRLPVPSEIQVEQWIAAVNGEPVLVDAGTPPAGAARYDQRIADDLWMTAEVAGAPWQPEHELVMLQVTLRGDRLRQFHKGTQVTVEPNPLVVDAFRLIGFSRAPSFDASSDEGGHDEERREPDSYTVTALAEVRRLPGADGSDLLRFKLEPVLGDGGEVLLPVLAVPAGDGSAPAWNMASHDFQAVSAAAELALMLGGELDSTGYARLGSLAGAGGPLSGNAARRDLAAMITTAAMLAESGL